MSLIHTIAGTRRRLLVSLVAVLAPWLGVTLWAASWIRDSSQSATVDMAIITAWMLLTFVAAVLVATVVADRVFGEGWRRVNVLGLRASDSDEDLAGVGAATRPQTLPVAIFVVVALIGLTFVMGLVTDDFFGWYARYGYATSTLRGDEQALQIGILEEMTRAQDDRLVRYTEMVEAVAGDPDADEAVRTQAVYALGEIGRRMVRSVELMEQGSKGGAWARDLHDRIRIEVEPQLVARFAAGARGDRERALIFALGAIRSEDAIALFRAALRSPDRDRDSAIAMIQALAGYRKPDRTVSVLLPALGGEDSELAGLAAWAIGETYGLGTGEASEAAPDPALVQLLASRLPRVPIETQCLMVDAMLRVRAEQHSRVLFDLWDAVEPRARCPRKVMARPFQAPLLLSKEEEMREKIVQALAGIAEGNATVMSWLRRQAADERIAEGLRADMGYILDVLAGRTNR